VDIIDAFNMMEDVSLDAERPENRDFSEGASYEAMWSSRGVSVEELCRVTRHRATFIAGNAIYNSVGSADAIEAGIRQGFLAGVLYERNKTHDAGEAGST
jgi:hypothetical protein